MRSAFLVFTVTAACSLLGCGRTRLFVIGMPPDAGIPDSGPAEAGEPPDAFTPSCVPAPAGGLTLGGFPASVLGMSVAVSHGTAYIATAASGPPHAMYKGTLFDVPSTGGAMQTLSAPGFNFGNLVTDGVRLYYPQTSGKPTGPNGSMYTTLGLAAIDLASGGVHPIPSATPPRQASSIPDSYMIAATPAWPGVFWIGAPTGTVDATGLFVWDPASDAVSEIATGTALKGVAVDASFVYWADTGGGQGITVYKRPLAGGAESVLATVPGGTYGQLLGVSSTDVVFVSDYATGAIMTVSKNGGAAKPLVTASSTWVNDSAWVGEGFLYWVENTDQMTLKRTPVAGGATDVVQTKGAIQSVAFDACNIYIGSTYPTQVIVRAK